MKLHFETFSCVLSGTTCIRWVGRCYLLTLRAPGPAVIEDLTLLRLFPCQVLPSAPATSGSTRITHRFLPQLQSFWTSQLEPSLFSLQFSHPPLRPHPAPPSGACAPCEVSDSSIPVSVHHPLAFCYSLPRSHCLYSLASRHSLCLLRPTGCWNIEHIQLGVSCS